jgi:hypothetical protein
MAETGNAFLDRLLEKTPAAPAQPKRGQDYNFPQRLFLKPDGEVVWLQGDPNNEAYYRKKGFYLLSEQPMRGQSKSEVRQFLEDEYPAILERQIEKASIINAIRRAVSNDRNLNVSEDDWENYTVEEMRDVLEQIKEETGRNIRVIKPRIKSKESEVDRMLSGLETTEDTSIEAVVARRRRGQEAPTP